MNFETLPTPAPSPDVGRLDFLTELRAVNSARLAAWEGDQKADGLFHATELGGETGEVLNVAKKLHREAMGWRGSRATMKQLGDEIGDVLICLDKLASFYGIDLAEVTARKFNATSVKVDLPHRLAIRSAIRQLANPGLEAELAELSAKATPGPWEADTIDSEGGSGRFKAYMIYGPDGKTIVDTHNSEVALLEWDADEDGSVVWDEVGRKDTAFIVALVNAYRAGKLAASPPTPVVEWPGEEEIARVVDADAWAARDTASGPINPPPLVERLARSLTKARAILALFPSRGEGK